MPRRLASGVRSPRGRLDDSARYSATRAKNEFGRLLEAALQGETVVITKHDSPKAVLISMDTFNNLTHMTEAKMNSLRDEFDALYADMQTPKARRAMRSLFSASPEQLGKAAVKAARKRR